MGKRLIALLLAAVAAAAARAGDYDAVFGHVRRMLVQSVKNDEAGLAATRQQLERVPRPAHQSAKEARAANQQGLEALKRNDYQAATIAFQQAQQLDPADVEVAGNLGYANLKLGQLKRAEHQLVYAVSLAPGRSSSWYNLGQVYGAMNEVEQATGAFANAYRFSQNRPKTQEFIRQALLSPESNDATRAALRRALERFGLPP